MTDHRIAPDGDPWLADDPGPLPGDPFYWHRSGPADHVASLRVRYLQQFPTDLFRLGTLAGAALLTLLGLVRLEVWAAVVVLLATAWWVWTTAGRQIVVTNLAARSELEAAVKARRRQVAQLRRRRRAYR